MQCIFENMPKILRYESHDGINLIISVKSYKKFANLNEIIEFTILYCDLKQFEGAHSIKATNRNVTSNTLRPSPGFYVA